MGRKLSRKPFLKFVKLIPSLVFKRNMLAFFFPHCKLSFSSSGISRPTSTGKEKKNLISYVQTHNIRTTIPSQPNG